MKPDTIDGISTQKPDTIDKNIYDKPNAYEEEEEKHYPLPPEVLEDLIIQSDFVDVCSPTSPSTTSLSTTGFPVLSPSVSSVSSTTSSSSATSSSRLALLEVLKKKPMEDMIRYELRKLSLTRPEQHDIYFYGTKVKAYKKIQPHSYSWGFQNTLYRVFNDEEIKVAETRRRAFKKDITVEWENLELMMNLRN
ncbi:unnamed protein product [Rhizopus stolonifer]